MPRVELTPVIGLPLAKGWAQVTANDSRQLVCALSVSGDNANNVGRDLSHQIRQSEPQSAAELHHLLLDLLSKTRGSNTQLQIAACLITADQSVLAAYDGQILLCRPFTNSQTITRNNSSKTPQSSLENLSQNQPISNNDSDFNSQPNTIKVGTLLATNQELKILQGNLKDNDCLVLMTNQGSVLKSDLIGDLKTGSEIDKIISRSVAKLHQNSNSSLSALGFLQLYSQTTIKQGQTEEDQPSKTETQPSQPKIPQNQVEPWQNRTGSQPEETQARKNKTQQKQTKTQQGPVKPKQKTSPQTQTDLTQLETKKTSTQVETRKIKTANSIYSPLAHSALQLASSQTDSRQTASRQTDSQAKSTEVVQPDQEFAILNQQAGRETADEQPLNFNPKEQNIGQASVDSEADMNKISASHPRISRFQPILTTVSQSLPKVKKIISHAARAGQTLVSSAPNKLKTLISSSTDFVHNLAKKTNLTKKASSSSINQPHQFQSQRQQQPLQKKLSQKSTVKKQSQSVSIFRKFIALVNSITKKISSTPSVLLHKLNQTWQQIKPGNEVYIQQRFSRKTVARISLVIVFIVLLIGSGLFIRNQRAQKKEAVLDEIQPAVSLLAEAQTLVDSNILQAREKTEQAIELLSAKDKKYQGDNLALNLIQGQLTTTRQFFEQISGASQLDRLNIFFDLRQIASNFLSSTATANQYHLFFLDQGQQQLIALNLITQKAQQLELDPEVAAVDLVATDENLYLLGNGIYQLPLVYQPLDSNQTKQASEPATDQTEPATGQTEPATDQDELEAVQPEAANINQTATGSAQNTNTAQDTDANQTATVQLILDPGKLTQIKSQGDSDRDAKLIEVFGSYLYVFNSEKRNIYRYIAGNDGLSDPIGWLTNKQGIEFSQVATMTINGSIWLGTAQGEIIELSRGEPVTDFSVSGVDPQFNGPINLFAKPEIENLYVLEPEKQRLVVLNKQGQFIQQIESRPLAGATSVLVNFSETTAYPVSGSIVYSLEL